jgi:hypothetical protein
MLPFWTSPPQFRLGVPTHFDRFRLAGWAYAPFAQARINATGYVVAKAGSRPEGLRPAIRMLVSRIDPAIPV